MHRVVRQREPLGLVGVDAPSRRRGAGARSRSIRALRSRCSPSPRCRRALSLGHWPCLVSGTARTSRARCSPCRLAAIAGAHRRRRGHKRPEVNSLPCPLQQCVLVSWLVPGAGHLVQGRRQKGVIFLIAIPVDVRDRSGARAAGCFPFICREPLVGLAAIANLGMGVAYFIATAPWPRPGRGNRGVRISTATPS